jgi:hypothetical protein
MDSIEKAITQGINRKANDHQVGGTHYHKGGEQHWDRIWRLYGPGYFVGCITKYIERYPHKNGVQDLEKAQHFLEKLLELERAKLENDDFYSQQAIIQSRKASGA